MNIKITDVKSTNFESVDYKIIAFSEVELKLMAQDFKSFFNKKYPCDTEDDIEMNAEDKTKWDIYNKILYAINN